MTQPMSGFQAPQLGGYTGGVGFGDPNSGFANGGTGNWAYQPGGATPNPNTAMGIPGEPGSAYFSNLQGSINQGQNLWAGQNQGAGNSNSVMSGTNQLGVTPYQVDPNAFNNPVGNQAQNWNNAMGSYLGNTTGGVKASVAPGYTAGTAGQLGMAQQYQNMAAGQGPSLATVQAGQQGAQNLAASESMLGSARGAGSPAAAQLSANNAATQGQQQVAQNAVAGRTQEELNAMQGASNLYGNVGQQGLTSSGQANQIAQGNQTTNLAAQNQYLGQLAAQNQLQYAGQMSGQQLGQTAYNNAQQNQVSTFNNAENNTQKNFSSLIGGGSGGMGGMMGALAAM